MDNKGHECKQRETIEIQPMPLNSVWFLGLSRFKEKVCSESKRKRCLENFLIGRKSNGLRNVLVGSQCYKNKQFWDSNKCFKPRTSHDMRNDLITIRILNGCVGPLPVLRLSSPRSFYHLYSNVIKALSCQDISRSEFVISFLSV